MVPRTALAGIVQAACTMLGAATAWLTVLHAPANAPIPAALRAMLAGIGVAGYNRSRA